MTLQNEFSFPAFSPERKIYTVQALVTAARGIVERDFAAVWVEGEISNLRKAPSGHTYFTLKDGEAQLPLVLFRRQSLMLRFAPKDGMQVLARGTLSVYEPRGQMQLIAETLEPRGAGALQIAFEQMRDRLRDEGLFAQERKRPLPAFPRCVGVITSLRGAVIHDITTILRRRHSPMQVVVYPASVQGETAALEAIAGLTYFNRHGGVDLIVLARGGGSAEDLACYNHEGLARAIVASALPVVSAVGHETDVTIADFAADVRAPTPSAAAELITASQHRLGEHMESLARRVERGLRYQTMRARERFERLALPAVLARVHTGLHRRQQRVDECRFRMEASLRACLNADRRRLSSLDARLERGEPARDVREAIHRWAALDGRLVRVARAGTVQRRAQWEFAAAKLHAYSPVAVLDRGYALVFDPSGHVVRTTRQLKPGDRTTTRVGNGTLESEVLLVHNSNGENKNPG